ncbi:AAA family ATPase [Rhizobium leguminosarum]|uniref:AAA family ATPase n=1 Tax=Rhizobium leguminosarum TaxID=384 RepID=UPI003F99C437
MSEIVTLRDGTQQTSENSFTVINGENGAGKSAILRIISDAALGLDASRSKVFASAIGIDQVGSVSRTIAISGTHNDRFPLNSGVEFRLNSNQFDLMHFYYYGPKQSGNYTSVSKASNTIAHSLLSDEQSSGFPSKQLTALLEFLGFEPEVRIVVQTGIRIKRREEFEYLLALERHLRSVQAESSMPSKIPQSFEFSISQASLLSERGAFRNLLGSRYSGAELSVDLRAERTIQVFDGPLFSILQQASSISLPQTLANFISLGLLTSKIVLFRKSTRNEVRLEDLSSGEWQLLYTLMNLSINISPDGLILIDEPENSLHPHWQTEYVSLVRKLISHVRGCHVIIATHSPLIAASIMPSDGNLIRLMRNHLSGQLYAHMEETAYGWLPSDVLQERFDLDSARPPELTRAINTALRLLKLSSEPTDNLRQAAEEIRKLKRYLPAHDPLLPAADAIIDIAFPDEGGPRDKPHRGE